MEFEPTQIVKRPVLTYSIAQRVCYDIETSMARGVTIRRTMERYGYPYEMVSYIRNNYLILPSEHRAYMKRIRDDVGVFSRTITVWAYSERVGQQCSICLLCALSDPEGRDRLGAWVFGEMSRLHFWQEVCAKPYHCAECGGPPFPTLPNAQSPAVV